MSDKISPEDLAKICQILQEDEEEYAALNQSGRVPNSQNGIGINGGRMSHGCSPREKNVSEFLDEMFQGRNSDADIEHRAWLEAMLLAIDAADEEICNWQPSKITEFSKKYRKSWPGIESDDEEENIDEKRGENKDKKNGKTKNKNKNKKESSILYMKSSPEYKERILDPFLIGIVARANLLATGKKPRMAQLVALLEQLCCENKGKLIQVSTGEGKTTIIGLHAAILILAGGNKERVDIVTSNKVLAMRDARDKKRRAFYEMLGLSVAHNIVPRSAKLAVRQRAYKADVIYGDLGAFQGDMLDCLHGENVRCGRPYANIIVDEVDSMLVDDITDRRILMLSHQIPGSEKLHCLMELAWKFWLSLQPLRPGIEHKPEEGYFELRKTDPDTGDQLIHQFKCPYMTDLIEKWMLDAINSSDRNNRLIIPEHLKEYARKQTKFWADSLVQAFAMDEGKHYKIAKDEHGFKCIKIVDYINTGTTQHQSRWSDGLHEFLEIKHELKIRKGSIVTLFSSNLEFIGRYGTNIYGLTGTLGSKPAQEFLKRLYPVELVFIPTFKRKRLEQLPGLLLANRNDWIEAIVDRVQQTVREGRAILVINETMNQVKALNRKLCSVLDRREAIHIRIYDDEDSAEQQREMEKCAEPGCIILSTNLSGRGTDIVTTEHVDANGGLFVLVCFLPLNMRVQMQNFGRTARQGRPGQCQMLLCRRDEMDEIQKYPNRWDFDEIIAWRDGNEKKELENFEREKLPKMKLRDRLFGKFAKVMDELVTTMKDQRVLRMQNEELWGIKLREIDNALAGASEIECTRMAESLISDVRRQLAENKRAVKGDFMKNSVYMLKQAQHNLGQLKHMANDYSKVNLEDTEKLIEAATNSEPVLNAFGYATHAMHDVIRSQHHFIAANADTDLSAHYRNQFIEHTRRAIQAADVEIDLLQSEQLVQGVDSMGTTAAASSSATSSNVEANNYFSMRNTRSMDSERAAQIRRRVELLREWQHEQMENMQRAMNCPEGQTIRIERYVNDEEIDEKEGKKNAKTDAENDDGVEEDVKEKKQMEEEKKDMNGNGRMTKFVIGYQKPEPSFWSGLALILLGVLQIGLGVVATCCFRPDWAYTLFTNGIQDIHKGILVMQGKATINWSEYWREKAITYSGTLLFSFGRFLMRNCPQLQRMLQNLFGRIGETQAQMATAGLGALFQETLRTEAVQGIIARNIQNQQNIADIVPFLDRNITQYVTQQYGPNTTIQAKLRCLLTALDVERVSAEFGDAIEAKHKEIASFCADIFACFHGPPANISGQLANLLLQIHIAMEHKLDAFIVEILPTMREQFEECCKDKAAWKGKEKDVADFLLRNGVLLDERVWALDAAAKLRSLNLRQFEQFRPHMDVFIELQDSEETKQKVQSAKKRLKQLILDKIEIELKRHAGQYQTSAEDVRNLADAFRKLRI